MLAFSASASGHLIYLTGTQSLTQLGWYDRAGKLLGGLGPRVCWLNHGCLPMVIKLLSDVAMFSRRTSGNLTLSAAPRRGSRSMRVQMFVRSGRRTEAVSFSPTTVAAVRSTCIRTFQVARGATSCCSSRTSTRFPMTISRRVSRFYRSVRWRRLLKLQTRVGKAIANESRAKVLPETILGESRRHPQGLTSADDRRLAIH